MVAPGNFLKYRFKDSFLRVSPLNANFFQWLAYFQEWDGCFYIILPTFISDFLRIVLKVWLKKCMKLWFKDSFVRVWPVCANEGAVATWDKSSQHQNCENLFSSGHKISCEIHQAICSGWPKGFRVSKLTCTNNFLNHLIMRDCQIPDRGEKYDDDVTRLLSDLLSYYISRHDTTRKVVTLSNPHRGPQDRVCWGQSLPLNEVAGLTGGWWRISCHDYHVHRRGCTRVLGSKFANKWSCWAMGIQLAADSLMIRRVSQKNINFNQA